MIIFAGDICQEYKEELKRLKSEYKKLLAKVKDQEMKSDVCYNKILYSIVSSMPHPN